MLCYQDLTIEGASENLDAFMDFLTKSLEGWTRNVDREKELQHGTGMKYIIIRTPPNSGLPDANIALYKDERSQKYRVANIVPVEMGSLSKEQSNSILQAFYAECIRDNISKFELQACISNEYITSRDVLSETNAELLHRFSVVANKSTGSSHPCDGRRWRDFITSSFNSEQILDSGILFGLLLDEEWPEEQANELVCEYEAAMDVLRNFTGQERFS
jgi:hypothetical protein